MSTTQRHGDRCCRGNGAAAAWIFQANKHAPSSSSTLPLPTPPETTHPCLMPKTRMQTLRGVHLEHYYIFSWLLDKGTSQWRILSHPDTITAVAKRKLTINPKLKPENLISYLTEIVWNHEKYAYLLCCKELYENVSTPIMHGAGAGSYLA